MPNLADSDAVRTESGSRFPRDVAALRSLVRRAAAGINDGQTVMLPGNIAFLEDGRVLCRERDRGDSRYPYGRDGFSFWVHSSGCMYGNQGAFYAFLPPQIGQDPSIAFFVGRRQPDGSYRAVSMLPTPFTVDAERAVRDRYCVLGHDAAYFAIQTPSLFGVVRVLVNQTHQGHTDIAFSILLQNEGQETLDLFVSAYIDPFCRRQFMRTHEDRWFKRVALERGAATGGTSDAAALDPFLISVNEDVNRSVSVTNRALLRRVSTGRGLDSEICTSRLDYVGSLRAGLGQSACLTRGGFERQTALTVFNDDAVAADLHRFSLRSADSIRFDYVLSLMNEDDAFEEEARTPISPATVDGALTRNQSDLRDEPRQLELRVSGTASTGASAETLNAFMPYLIRQVAVCAQTEGFMQPAPNSLIGFRDIFQAIEAQLYDRPDLAADKIREALAFVLVDGRCPRQYSLMSAGQPSRADLREFIDQGAWAISTLHTFLAVTGDASILSDALGYHQLCDGRESAIEPAEGAPDTVFDHLIRIMGYMARARDRDTGLLRVLYGDWNDAVDGLGATSDPAAEFGSGVSIMASLQFYRNCHEMIDLLERYYPGLHLDVRREYRVLRDELRDALLLHAVAERAGQRRIVHGWGDKQSYFVGSFQDSDGKPRISLTSNAFWVLSGMLSADATLRDDILAAMKRLDSRYGLKTFEPGFAPDAPGVGRVRKLPIGTAENAATYVHATAFGIMALFQMGEPRRAWEQIQKILPFAPHQHGISHSPFVMPNSYVHNPTLNLSGQNMNDWQTGSSNVLLKTLIRCVFGFRPGFDALEIGPASWSPFERLELAAVTHGRRVRIITQSGETPERSFCLNGIDLPASAAPGADPHVVRIPYEKLTRRDENLVQVFDPPRESA